MDTLYGKTVLYLYANLEEYVERIDECVERRAILSMGDFSPVEEQCYKILAMTEQKVKLIKLFEVADKTLKEFSGDDILCLDYKYFKTKQKNEYAQIDYTSRAYYRKQVRLARQFSERLEKNGLTDQIFEQEYLPIDLCSLVYNRVKENEILTYKNKGKTAKIKG